MIEIKVNGKIMAVKPNISIKDLLDQLGIAPTMIAVELNKKVVNKDKYLSTCLQDGDRLEIVQFVGGG